jgi:hypothetical protein
MTGSGDPSKLATAAVTPEAVLDLIGSVVAELHPGRAGLRQLPPVHPGGGEWSDAIKLRDSVRARLLRYCGEPDSRRISPTEEESGSRCDSLQKDEAITDT